ncbi:DUF5363 family protein [Cricetibacter osteomyelitidis]|nr:DUF5363 family protein [Cricetibacter osteomyelitidis]
MEEKKAEQKKPEKPQSWFKRALAKYNSFCKEAGIDNGACRSCVPIVKQDPESGGKGKSSV